MVSLVQMKVKDGKCGDWGWPGFELGLNCVLLVFDIGEFWAIFSADYASGGAIAQLGEHLTGSQEVRGSIPLGSTNSFWLVWPIFRS